MVFIVVRYGDMETVESCKELEMESASVTEMESLFIRNITNCEPNSPFEYENPVPITRILDCAFSLMCVSTRQIHTRVHSHTR
jgi:hypothetical protein